jgi:hypothetical protein
LNTKKCHFPLNMPVEVFWTKRTMEQMKEGLIPLPNIHLLPAEFHYLYPSLFPANALQKVTATSAAVCTANRPSTSKAALSTGSVSELSADLDTSDLLTGHNEESDLSPIGNDLEDAPAGPCHPSMAATSETLCEGAEQPERSVDTVLYETEENHRKQWAESLLRIQAEQKQDGKQMISPSSSHPSLLNAYDQEEADFSLSTTNNREELSSTPQQADSARMEKQPYTSTANALNSVLSLRFADDRFTSGSTPKPKSFSIGNRRRNFGQGRNLKAANSKKLFTSQTTTNQKEGSSLTHLWDTIDQVAALPSEFTKLQNQSSSASLSARLGRPLNSGYRPCQAKPSGSANVDSSYADLSNVEKTTSATTLSDVTRSSGSTASDTNTASQRKQSKRSIGGKRCKIESFGDPDLDNLVKRKLKEVLKESRQESRQRRSQTNPSSSQRNPQTSVPSQPPQLVDEFGFAYSDLPDPNVPPTNTQYEPVAEMSQYPEQEINQYSTEDDLGFDLDDL